MQRKEEARKKIKEEQEMKDFTGKPEINSKSKSIVRKVDDLLDWKEKQELKREKEIKKKNEQELIEIDKIKNKKVVNKKSEQIIEQKFKSQSRKEKVEERLTRDASIR